VQHQRPLPPRTRRNQFATDRLETASSSSVLLLCFDRLDRDLTMARSAIAEHDHFATNQHLGHAQDLLGEVAAMLDVDVWEHSGSLLAVYDYVLRLLARANTSKSEAMVGEAQRLLDEIGDAFRTAARTAATSIGADAGDSQVADRPRLSVQA
jgi:flagellar secretion chaperone FliS